MHENTSMKRMILFSLLSGIVVTGALSLLSQLAVRFFPYRDIPMMPKPFFLYALSPGILGAEVLSLPHWAHETMVYATNCVAYGAAVLLATVMVRVMKRAG